MPVGSFERRTDAEIGKAWRFATREANSVYPIMPGDIPWLDAVIDEVRCRAIRPSLENVPDEPAPSDVPSYKVELKQRVLSPPGVVVALERRTPQLPTTAELTSRHGLTAREAQVGLLIAEGRNNTEIAQSLGVTAHTARRHTERVLAKLGVHSRAAAASRLRER